MKKLIKYKRLEEASVLNDKNKIKVTNFSAQNVISIGEAGGISGNYHYAFNDQVGWLDFAYSGGNIFVPINDGELSGAVKILSDDSWLYLNCLNLDYRTKTKFSEKSLTEMLKEKYKRIRSNFSTNRIRYNYEQII